MSAAPPNPHKGRTGIDRIVHASAHSAHGLVDALRHESAFRQELLAAIVLLPLAAWLGRTWVEVALLAGAVVLVLIVELLNSGIEAAVDHTSLEIHPLAKRAKDYASAAVLLTLALCGTIWLVALWQRFGS